MLTWISGGVPVDDTPAARVIAASMREFELAVPLPRYPSDDQLRGLHVPTLALIGGRSQIHHPRKAYDRARALLPDGEVELWPQASHAISGELATAVSARVLQFVHSVEPR